MKPEIRDVRSVVRDAQECSSLFHGDGWSEYVPARSQGWGQLRRFQRFRAAWLVFTGRADAITYPGQ
jgi:hypothetical protein